MITSRHRGLWLMGIRARQSAPLKHAVARSEAGSSTIGTFVRAKFYADNRLIDPRISQVEPHAVNFCYACVDFVCSSNASSLLAQPALDFHAKVKNLLLNRN